tara:strand:- start:764 stop:1012 length:249 start_codon:yes stop_codon:yes gene_type:complete
LVGIRAIAEDTGRDPVGFQIQREKALSHLSDRGQNYFQHFWSGISVAGQLAYLAVTVTVHAFIPWVLKTTTSDHLKRIIDKI